MSQYWLPPVSRTRSEKLLSRHVGQTQRHRADRFGTRASPVFRGPADEVAVDLCRRAIAARTPRLRQIMLLSAGATPTNAAMQTTADSGGKKKEAVRSHPPLNCPRPYLTQSLGLWQASDADSYDGDPFTPVFFTVKCEESCIAVQPVEPHITLEAAVCCRHTVHTG